MIKAAFLKNYIGSSSQRNKEEEKKTQETGRESEQSRVLEIWNMNNPSSSLPPFLGAIGVEGYSQNLQVMQQIHPSTAPKSQISSQKKRRNQPGHPSPDSEVIALSPKTLTATNRFKCEVCNKGFQREQNLQLHRRGHNLPWKLIKKKPTKEIIRRKVYVCPEVSCVHHEPSRALGDLTGIKKHYYRKHGEKKWKCDKCCKKYAVQSDWKAHSKICGTKEYRCCCGTLFSRRDSFITHRTLCSTMSQDSSRNPHNMSLSGFSQISTNFSPISHFNTLQEYPNSTALNNRRNPNAIFTQNPSQRLLIHQDHGGFFINSPLNKHESIQTNMNIMDDGFFSGDYKNFSFLNHKQSDSPQVHQDRHISNFINNNYGEHHNHQVQDPGARNTNADPSTTMFKGLDSCFRLNIGNNGFGGHMGDLSNNLQGLMNTFGDGGGFNVEDTFEGKTLQELRAVTTSSSKLTLDFSLGSEMKFSTEQFDRG